MAEAKRHRHSSLWTLRLQEVTWQSWRRVNHLQRSSQQSLVKPFTYVSELRVIWWQRQHSPRSLLRQILVNTERDWSSDWKGGFSLPTILPPPCPQLQLNLPRLRCGKFNPSFPLAQLNASARIYLSPNTTSERIGKDPLSLSVSVSVWVLLSTTGHFMKGVLLLRQGALSRLLSHHLTVTTILPTCDGRPSFVDVPEGGPSLWVSHLVIRWIH